MQQEGVFLTNYEIDILQRADVPIGASKVLLELKRRGGIAKSQRSLVGNISDWEVRGGANYLESHKVIFVEKQGERKSSRIILNTICEELRGTARNCENKARRFDESCKISANDLKESNKENTADSESYGVNSSSVVSTSQSQNIQPKPSVTFSSDSKSESSEKDDISLSLQKHFNGGKNSCQEEFKLIAKKVIEHLKEKTGKNFRSEGKMSEAHKKHIIARLNDGATEKDLIAVIDHKTKEWLHPKGDDKDMSKYLTPETLFRASNFSKYLAAAEEIKPKRKTLDELIVYLEEEYQKRGHTMTEEEWYAEEHRLNALWREGKL